MTARLSFYSSRIGMFQHGDFSLMGKLISVQIAVMPAAADQGVVIAVFNDSAVLDNENPAGGFDRRKTMRNHKAEAMPQNAIDRGLDGALGLRVDGAGGFIHDEN